jgi:hypothetical protein
MYGMEAEADGQAKFYQAQTASTKMNSNGGMRACKTNSKRERAIAN